MASFVGTTLGERVAELRRRRSLSQKELATEVGRSESWVSQVERDVLTIERVSVLQVLADALGVSLRDLRPEVRGPAEDNREPGLLASLRLVLTGHPALRTLLSTEEAAEADLADLQAKVDDAWRLTHASQFTDLAALLGTLLPDLEKTARHHRGQRRVRIAGLLTTTYNAAAAAFARQDEADAAWLAADRAIRWAEDAGDPLGAVAGGFRMGHAFLTLRQLDQAEHVAAGAISALDPLVQDVDCPPDTLSLYGAMHLLLALVHAREGDRVATRNAIQAARDVAARMGGDRNDYNTEFGPTNVDLHAVSTAVDLGDAGEALELAGSVDASRLSPERQSRLWIDIARAHAQRRHVGDAVAALLEAEQLTPEQVQASSRARDMVHDLLNLAGRRATPELQDLARRLGVLP